MKTSVFWIAFVTFASFNMCLGQASAPATKELSEHDKLRIAVQDICPVSGLKLGKHGNPIKVRIGKQKEEVFLCCKGCAKRKINPQHWATIHGNFARAQGICPVMKHPLPKKPKWTFVNGQIVYVCCAPCTKKIAKDPQGTLAQLDKLYLASLQTKKKKR